MADHNIATIINFCSNDCRFIHACVQEASVFSKQIVVPVCDHFFDGTPEDRATLEAVYRAFPQCLFVEYPFLPSLISSRGQEAIHAGQFWHSFPRWLAVRYLRKDVQFVFFLDSDEVADGERTLQFLNHVNYRNTAVAKFANYWYFREATFRATTYEDSVVLARKADLNDAAFLHSEDRDAIYPRLPAPKYRGVAGLDRKPLFHHYSWVRTEEEMLKKVRCWGHRNDRPWEQAVREEFSRPFSGTDFVHGYSYEIVPLRDELRPEASELIPRGAANVHRLTAAELTEIATPAIAALVQSY